MYLWLHWLHWFIPAQHQALKFISLKTNDKNFTVPIKILCLRLKVQQLNAIKNIHKNYYYFLFCAVWKYLLLFPHLSSHLKDIDLLVHSSSKLRNSDAQISYIWLWSLLSQMHCTVVLTVMPDLISNQYPNSLTTAALFCLCFLLLCLVQHRLNYNFVL